MSGQCWTKDGQPKKRFRTRHDAKNSLRASTAKGRDTTGMHAYRCSECGWFHLGHYPTSPAIRKAKRAAHRATNIVDRILIGPTINGPRPNTPRLPFRPLWDERRLDHMHVIDDDDVTPPFPGGDRHG